MNDLITSTIYVAARSGTTAHGDPSFAAPVALQARVEHARRTIRSITGEAYSVATIWTLTALPIGSRVWLPGESSGDASQSHTVIVSELLQTPDGSVAYYEAAI